MDVKFTVSTTNDKDWLAECKDPALEAAGLDIISASKNMAGKLEAWFIETFHSDRQVIVEVPAITATIKATVTVRPETPLDNFTKSTDKVEAVESDPKVTKLEELVQCSRCGMDVMVPVGTPNPLCEQCDYEIKVSIKNGEIDDSISERRLPALPRPKARKAKNVSGPCKYQSDGKGLVPAGTCEALSNEPSDTPGIKADPEGTCNGEYESCPFYKPGGPAVSPPVPEEEYGEDIIGEDWESDQ